MEGLNEFLPDFGEKRKDIFIPNGRGWGKDYGGCGYGYQSQTSGIGKGYYRNIILNGNRVYRIGGRDVILCKITGDHAIARELKTDLTTERIIIVKNGKHYGFGASYPEAKQDADVKVLLEMELTERAETFVREHKTGKKYGFEHYVTWESVFHEVDRKKAIDMLFRRCGRNPMTPAEYVLSLCGTSIKNIELCRLLLPSYKDTEVADEAIQKYLAGIIRATTRHIDEVDEFDIDRVTKAVLHGIKTVKGMIKEEKS